MKAVPAFPRIFPFALFMTFIGVGEALHALENAGFVSIEESTYYYLYPIKTFAVLLSLMYFWRHYSEISLADLRIPRNTIISLATGLFVFVMWINLDFPFATIGTLQGFDPNIFQEPAIRSAMIVVRIAGAVIVVPIMEELFWRSFLVRYLVDKDYWRVPIGVFTVSSFFISSLLFGLEHNLFLAGILAGVCYNLLLYFTKSISQCILSHALTNLCLGIYVLATGKWYFW